MNLMISVKMWRTAVRLTPTFILPITGKRGENDYVINSKTAEKPQTGWDRIKKMFEKNEFGENTVELHSVVQSSLCGVFIGACFGGFVKSKDAYIYFIENNQASIYKSTNEAKKKLQDYVTIAFAKGACHWGWRLGVFTGMFSLIATLVAVYRDQTALTDYIIAGSVTGALYKANLGLAAALVGAGLGAVLSTISGIAILSILKVTGVTMDDLRKALYSIKEARKDQYSQAVEKSAQIKNDGLTRHHDTMVNEKGKQTIEELKD